MRVHIRRRPVEQHVGAALIVGSGYAPPYRSCLKGHVYLRIDADIVSCTGLAGAKPDPSRPPGAPAIAGSAGDVQLVQTFTSESAPHRAVIWEGLGFQYPACRRHNVNQRPGSGLVGSGAD